MPTKRLSVAILALGFLAASCTGAIQSDTTPEQNMETQAQGQSEKTQPGPGQTETPEVETEASTGSDSPTEGSGSCEDPFEGSRPSFSTTYWEETNFCKHSVDYSTIMSGGVPPDGIPPIDSPTFVDVSDANEWLKDREPVISLQVEDEVRAYPLQIMTWHEIVNDELGGKPVLVTFCPLCNTALVFERPTIDGQTLTFGTSGNLRNSDLVMYDRQTASWWQQFSGKAIVGDLTGKQLKFLPSAIVSWGDFKNSYPNGKVLSRDTGYNRQYGRNPYAGYDDIDSSPFLFRGETDDRLKPMARIVGIRGDNGAAKSYSYQRLEEEKVIHGTLGETPIVIFWKGGTASALDSSNLPEGRDVGATGVFEATIDGQNLTFTAQGDGTFTDQETDSTWDILGHAIEGPMEGKSLTSIPHHDTFWFAWAAFEKPESLVE